MPKFKDILDAPQRQNKRRITTLFVWGLNLSFLSYSVFYFTFLLVMAVKHFDGLGYFLFNFGMIQFFYFMSFYSFLSFTVRCY